jgi:hypothetical protein
MGTSKASSRKLKTTPKKQKTGDALEHCGICRATPVGSDKLVYRKLVICRTPCLTGVRSRQNAMTHEEKAADKKLFKDDVGAWQLEIRPFCSDSEGKNRTAAIADVKKKRFTTSYEDNGNVDEDEMLTLKKFVRYRMDEESDSDDDIDQDDLKFEFSRLWKNSGQRTNRRGKKVVRVQTSDKIVRKTGYR